MSIDKTFAAFATRTARATGSPWAFCACVALVLGWAVSGPLFKFSEGWQLVINTGTTIVTFLMVFLIQNTQNRDGAAIQAKLDELILASEAENEFVGIERLTDKELGELHQRCLARAKAHEDAHERVKAEMGRRQKRPSARKPSKSGSAKGKASVGRGSRRRRAAA